MPKEKTNTEFVNKLMEYSNNGALMQVFVITAIEKYAEMVKAEGEPKGPVSHFIDPQAWLRCAEEALAKLEEQYCDLGKVK